MDENQFKSNFSIFLIAGIAVIGFSHFVFQLFSVTIPNVMITFFKEAGFVLVIFAVFLFASAWLLRAKPRNRPKKISLVIFDVYGKEVQIEGIRADFKTHDVAWSFMKQYKIDYPLNNFAMVTEISNSKKRVIIKYV